MSTYIRQTLEDNLPSENPFEWDLDEIVHDCYWRSGLAHPIERWNTEMLSLFKEYASALYRAKWGAAPSTSEVETFIKAQTGRSLKTSTDSMYFDVMAVAT